MNKLNNMSNKIIKIGGQTLEMREYETTASERPTYGLNVYIAWDVNCALWEYLMPSYTIREKAYRGVSELWRDFISGDKDGLLNQFLYQLNRETGLTFHLVSQWTLPSSVYETLARKGFSFNNEVVHLVVYGNNR